MGLENMKNQSFPHFGMDEWESQAVDSLKGKAIETFQATTYENIKLKPLYTQEDVRNVSQFPGGTDYRRGADPLGYFGHNWKVAQRLSYRTAEELKEKLVQALSHGQNALSFELSDEFFSQDHFMADLLTEVFKKYPFAMDANEYQKKFLTSLEIVAKTAEDRAKVTGYIGSDPLSSFAVQGSIPTNPDAFFTQWSETVRQANEKFPGLRTILINTAPYHNGGANAIQELGIALASGVYYIQLLLDKGMELEEAFAKVIFNFSIGTNFFIEIAKLRAARIVWNKIGEVYGVDEKSRGMQIAAETSRMTQTVFDPYVNILRSGNEAFAAVLGGIQYLHVRSFDDIIGSNSFSDRIARNTQLILQQEAHLQQVIDPAGGSWYVEALTQELAEQAWAFFQEIETSGGMIAALKSNWIQEKIAAVHEKRQHDIFTRNKMIVGTNMFVNLKANETISEEKGAELPQSGNDQYERMSIPSIPQTRLSEPYESLRKRSAALKQKAGVEPEVALICLGSLKQYKPRLDFVKGFLAAGGINVVASDSVLSPEMAKEFLEAQSCKHVCICGSNDLYPTLGFEIVKLIKGEFLDWTTYLAGLPEKQEQSKWKEAGLKQFFYAGSNCYEALSAILSEMEVSIREQAQA